MLYGHPLSRELEAYTARRNVDQDVNRAFWSDFYTLLGTKLDEMTSDHVNEGPKGEKRFGMSGAGSCTRKATLKYLGYEGEPIDGATRLTWDLGHILEIIGIATLRGAGYAAGTAGQNPVYIDPFMHSFSDDVLPNLGRHYGKPIIYSSKSISYKMSGQQRGKWVRRGFTELPFEGVRAAQPSAWAQAQAEMHASGIEATIIQYTSKDVVQAFKKDPYVGPEGNGSLVFYTELIEYDPVFCAHELIPVWGQMWDAATDGKAGTAFVYNPTEHRYIRLPKPGDSEAGWGGPNQAVTGTFNPCGGPCEVAEACKKELAKAFRR